MDWRRVRLESIYGGIVSGFFFGLGLVLLAALLALIINLWTMVEGWM